jgi:hypothetical protein
LEEQQQQKFTIVVVLSKLSRKIIELEQSERSGNALMPIELSYPELSSYTLSRGNQESLGPDLYVTTTRKIDAALYPPILLPSQPT